MEIPAELCSAYGRSDLLGNNRRSASDEQNEELARRGRD
jgi:hypothetical protein